MRGKEISFLAGSICSSFKGPSMISSSVAGMMSNECPIDELWSSSKPRNAIIHACRHEPVVTVVIVSFLVLVALPRYDPQKGASPWPSNNEEKTLLCSPRRRQMSGLLDRRHLARRSAGSGIYTTNTTAGLAHAVLAGLGGVV